MASESVKDPNFKHDLDLQKQNHAMEVDSPCSPPTLKSLCIPRTRFRKRATLCQKLGAEVIATFILVFAGAGAGMVNELTNGSLTFFGVAAANGLVVMMMIHATGHISGAHMNPAVTVAFATVRHFPWAQVPLYIGSQIAASVSACFVLRQLLTEVNKIGATVPAAGNVVQALVLEIIVSYILMFVVAAVSTDTRAVGELAGLAVGATVALNNLIAGPLSGASMNPARSIGPAVARNNYSDVWIYIVGPVLGTLGGAWSYNLIRTVDKNLSSSRSFSSRSFNKRDQIAQML
ncbi:aquaporin NIP6-1 [Selaginella moellendorffii]|uniref:aquaporin NIP6-1 n=1 Tax=Selaginella moellendorffii TaxID=88036 RepID=UPI000D1CA304|nr:aquaporin NIP6-1 [Selaginella moellendorffii]XP_024516289.1 aquaporin NIP6-1 [Selaginella moellendorffii]XP_024516290.1 aquaporin NIP6-1 [Selaginella moellendorffii]XP_024516291.1 aquaporin NIP6-1 [Selaginella moellendorffii]XP_024516292.1 aquaporin NIP6-1 [Selaginella moellendorffii]|eukprot:XP_002986711.2 aquaporin NIP6-1 [Selaginella moellendorffii]